MLKRTLSSLFVLVITVFFVFPFTANAEDDQVGYSVQALLPDNQVESKHSYFDLLMEPEQKQELEAVIYNNENEDIDVQVSVHNASTNRNGLVVYEKQEELDPSLETLLSDILTLEEHIVTIPAGKSKRITTQLEMPEEEYDGIILGGLHFEKVIKDEESSEGVNLQNKYAYVIGVQLSENDNDVSPNLDLSSIQPELVNHRTAVVANIQNSEAVLMNDMTINAEIFKKEEEEPIKEKEQAQINMAPNSTMGYTIDWENDPLEPGVYILKMEAVHESETWNWEEEFVIEDEDASDLNENAVELNDNNINKWFVLGIIILIIIIASLLFYIWRLKHKQDEVSAKDQNQNRKGEE